MARYKDEDEDSWHVAVGSVLWLAGAFLGVFLVRDTFNWFVSPFGLAEISALRALGLSIFASAMGLSNPGASSGSGDTALVNGGAKLLGVALVYGLAWMVAK